MRLRATSLLVLVLLLILFLFLGSRIIIAHIDSQILHNIIHEVLVNINFFSCSSLWLFLFLFLCIGLFGGLLSLSWWLVGHLRELEGFLEGGIFVLSITITIHVVVVLVGSHETWLDVGIGSSCLNIGSGLRIAGSFVGAGLLHRETDGHGKLRVHIGVDAVCSKIIGTGTTSSSSCSRTHIVTLKDWRGNQNIGDVGDTLRHIKEVTRRSILSTLVCCLNKSLKSGNVVTMRKVNDIDRNIVLLKAHAQVFEVLLSS